MRLCYENDIDDLVAFQLHLYNSSANATRNKRMIIIVIYLLFLGFSLVAPTTDHVSRPNLILIMMAAATFTVVIYGSLINWCLADGTKRLAKERTLKGNVGPHELEPNS